MSWAPQVGAAWRTRQTMHAKSLTRAPSTSLWAMLHSPALSWAETFLKLRDLVELTHRRPSAHFTKLLSPLQPSLERLPQLLFSWHWLWAKFSKHHYLSSPSIADAILHLIRANLSHCSSRSLKIYEDTYIIVLYSPYGWAEITGLSDFSHLINFSDHHSWWLVTRGLIQHLLYKQQFHFAF